MARNSGAINRLSRLWPFEACYLQDAEIRQRTMRREKEEGENALCLFRGNYSFPISLLRLRCFSSEFVVNLLHPSCRKPIHAFHNALLSYLDRVHNNYCSNVFPEFCHSRKGSREPFVECSQIKRFL